jgi:synaptotagmin-like protein
MGSIFHDAKPHICVKGQVEFGLQYNYKLACLEVRVKQCRDLAAVDNKRNRSDPYES